MFVLGGIVFFGLKTVAWLDIWSIEHVLSGISIGAAVRKKSHAEIAKIVDDENHSHTSFHFDIVSVLCAAYIWETFEHYLEVGVAGARIETWFQGVEFWGNRAIADPALLVLGYLISRRWPHLVWPARVASAAWLLLHIFLFPDSMYLQRSLFGA